MRLPERTTNEASRSPLARLRFQLFITLAKRAILIRDDAAGWLAGRLETSGDDVPWQPVKILSETRCIEGCLLLPEQTARASVLILHGIGERLEYWQEAQRLLAGHGIASLIFDYSGYRKSTGATTPANLRADTVAAYAELRRLVPAAGMPFLLGLSLGTGVAIDAAPHLQPPPAGVILCEAFTSLRSGAVAIMETISLPPMLTCWLAKLLPDVYRTADSITEINSPLLLVHSDTDELFPVEMAGEIFAAAPKGSALLHVPKGFAHNDAYLNPSLDYWGPILDFVLAAEKSAKLKEAARR